MSFNGAINGDWSKCNFTLPPFVGGIAELTHEEVVGVIEALPEAETALPDLNMVVSKYNNSTNWEKPINGDTYACIKGYNPEVNKDGIDTQGIVQPLLIGDDAPEYTEENVETPVEEV